MLMRRTILQFYTKPHVIFIHSLPSSLSTLTHLVSLQLDGNPIRSIRRDIIQGGTVRILKLLRDRFSQEEHDDEAKSTASSVIGSENKTFPDRSVINKNYSAKKRKNSMCHHTIKGFKWGKPDRLPLVGKIWKKSQILCLWPLKKNLWTKLIWVKINWPTFPMGKSL